MSLGVSRRPGHVQVESEVPMRILHMITRFLRSGGSERDLMALMDWERRHGHEVWLAVGRDSDLSEIPQGVNVRPVESLVRSVSPIQDLKAWRDLRRLVRELKPDVVHTHQSKAGILGRLAARGRAAAIVHTVVIQSFGDAYSRPASAAFVLAERYCTRFTNVVVSVGEELCERYLHAGIGRREQYEIVRSPINLDAFISARSTPDDERNAYRARLGVSPGEQLLVAVGTLEPRKRPRLIVQQLAPLLRENTVLALAGEGSERQTLETLIGSLGLGDRVRLLGHISDVPLLLGSADIYVHAATVEGVPQTILQAIAAGVPIVATDTVGLREIEDAPVTIVPSDGSTLVDAVAVVLREPPEPVMVAAMKAWRPEDVERQTAELHARVSGIVRAATGAPSP